MGKPSLAMHTPHRVKRFLYGLILVHVAFSQAVAGDSADTEVGEELLPLLYEALKPEEIPCPNDATCRCIRFNPERALAFAGYMYAKWCPIDAGNDLAKGHWKVTNWDQEWKKMSDGEYLDEKMHGTWTYWHAGGRKEVQEEFDQGRRIGTSYRWHENGVIAITGKHVDGEQHGVWIFRDEGGRITRRVYWDKGKVVSCQTTLAEALAACGEYDWATLKQTYISFLDAGSAASARELLMTLPAKHLGPDNGSTAKDTKALIFSPAHFNELTKRAHEGDHWAIRILFRLLNITDGARSSEIDVELGSLITEHPEKFLVALEESVIETTRIDALLGNLGPDHVDQFDRMLPVLEARYQAIEGVDGVSESIKERCLSELKYQIAQVKELISLQ